MAIREVSGSRSMKSTFAFYSGTSALPSHASYAFHETGGKTQEKSFEKLSEWNHGSWSHPESGEEEANIRGRRYCPCARRYYPWIPSVYFFAFPAKAYIVQTFT